MLHFDYCTLFPVIYSHWVYFIYSLPLLTCFQVAGRLRCDHDMRCFCMYVQSAPGGDLGCQVYVAGDTLVRREKVEVKTKLCRLMVLYDLECMLYVMLCLEDVFITWCIWGTAPV